METFIRQESIPAEFRKVVSSFPRSRVNEPASSLLDGVRVDRGSHNELSLQDCSASNALVE